MRILCCGMINLSYVVEIYDTFSLSQRPGLKKQIFQKIFHDKFKIKCIFFINSSTSLSRFIYIYIYVERERERFLNIYSSTISILKPILSCMRQKNIYIFKDEV